MKEQLKIKGQCIIKRFNVKTKEILDIEIKNNLIVDIGKINIAKDLIELGYKYNAIIVGDGVATGTPNTSEIELISYVKGALATRSYEVEFKTVYVATILFTSAYTITEVALARIIANGDILNHVIFSPGKEVDSETGLEITFKITILS